VILIEAACSHAGLEFDVRAHSKVVRVLSSMIKADAEGAGAFDVIQ